MTELLGLLLLAALGWFWLDSMAARETAGRAGKRACEREGVQFLDDTVVIVRLRPARDHRGRLHLHRTYRFEFSDTGDNRLEGNIVMLGRRIESLTMEPHRLTETPYG
ncbi:MAG: DUF3301 domain-containing protein [Betaproteobacteria bacterium]